jgi:hypothetical protein
MLTKLFEDFTGDGYREEVMEDIHRAMLEFYEGEEFNVARRGASILCWVVYNSDFSHTQFRYTRPDGKGETTFFAKFDGKVTFTPVFKDVEELRFLWEIGVGEASSLVESIRVEGEMTIHVGEGVDWSSSFSWNTEYTSEEIQRLGTPPRRSSTYTAPDFYRQFKNLVSRKFWYFGLDLHPHLDAAERSLTQHLDQNFKKYF